MRQTLNSVIDRFAALPGILHWRRHRFRRAFAKGEYLGQCDGIFTTYRDAAAAAPTSLPLGYDNAGAASLYRERLDRVYPGDYPMMVWLAKALSSEPGRVFDLGGHVGIGYYAYRRYIDYPANLAWQVCDVAAVVEAGRELARERDPDGRISFTDRFADGDGSGILFTSGCLQYLEDTLAQRIGTWKARPTWVLVNLLPLHETHSFWTVQNIGRAFCPYRIQRKAVFFTEMEALGYERRDVWENLEKSCHVKFFPAYSLDRYGGAAFRLK